MPRGVAVQEYQCGVCFGLHLAGQSLREIEQRTGIPKSTVADILQNPQPLTQFNTGRPKKLSIRCERHIIRTVKQNPRVTYQKVREICDTDASDDTIRRLLSTHRMKRWIAKKRPRLTKEHAKKRLVFALKYKDWTYDEWSKIIFSNECSIQRGSGLRPNWVFRTPEDKWKAPFIQPIGKKQDISIII